MCKRFQYALILTVFCGVLNMSAQNPPCPSGTLATVLGTSCSVGPLTLNFQNNFVAGSVVFDQGMVINRVSISATEIQFVPVNQGQEVGFKLIVNFIDGPGTDSSFGAGHFVQFSYTPQANPGFDIVGETVQIDASIQDSGANNASEDVIDFQNYPNIFSTSPNAFIIDQNGSISSHLTDQVLLPTPALFSEGFAGQPTFPTTFFQTQTAGTAQGTLKSAVFLYNVGPLGPLPPAALTYSSLDLPGAAGTFVSGITNAGRMVGAFQDAQGISHGYVTQKQGGFTTIDFPNAMATFANGLNDRGDLVGTYTDAAGNSHGFFLQDENFSTLDFPGAILTAPIAINDKQQIVGVYESADQGIHGFLLDHGGFTSIDHNPDNFVPPFTEVLGINNRGEVVGSFLEFVSLVGLIQDGDSFQTLIVPGQVKTFVQAVNEPGDQVGTYNDINDILHGFVRTNELFRTVDFPGGNLTTPLGINAAGEIVGLYFDSVGNAHSFLAEPRPDGGTAPDSASVNTGSALQSGALAQPAATRICGSPEWLQHPEQMRLSCKAASLSSSGSQK